MNRSAHPDTDLLAGLLDMAHKTRHVQSAVELEFIAVNSSHLLAPYRQAALWLDDRKICALSGVVQVEANAAYVHWLEQLCRQLGGSGPVCAADIKDDIAEAWPEWLPAYGLWLAFSSPASSQQSAISGGLLLARDIPWLEHEVTLLCEWIDIWQHAYKTWHKPARSLAMLKQHGRTWFKQQLAEQGPWWKRRITRLGALTILLLCFPVRLSVLAPGELVPAKPAVIRAPLDGVIERFHVRPNQFVKKGQPLFDFDETQLSSRYTVANQLFSTAEAEYRQSAQQALTDSKSKGQLAALQGKIEELHTNSEFLQTQLELAHVVAPQDGVVMFDDPGEWIGRPVATGERIMRVALPQDIEVEAWLPAGDAIPVEQGATTTLYLAASPLSPVSAEVRYVSHEAMQRPDGSYAYRVRARLSEATHHRVGLKGTAKVSGDWVTLVYWVLRRPLATIRQTLGW